MSEVVSYLLGFGMAFLILTTSIYGFQEINDSARRLNARAQMTDVLNQVAVGVQEAFLAASARNDTTTRTFSSTVRYDRVLPVPTQIQGWHYRVTLDEDNVTGLLVPPDMLIPVPTFNAGVSLPPPTLCDEASEIPLYAACELSGTVEGSNGRITISYLYDAVTPGLSNKIEIR